jgi:hypothetical protein
MHNQCTEDLETVCGNEGGAFLACLQGGAQIDAGTSDVGTQACNTIENVGQAVSKTGTPSTSAPGFTGGTIADGTYVLTEMLYYNPPTAPAGTRKETLVFSGGTLEAVYSINGAAEERYTATFETPSGFSGQISIHLTCFASAPSAALNMTTGYTATATEIQVSADAFEVSTYTKQ